MHLQVTPLKLCLRKISETKKLTLIKRKFLKLYHLAGGGAEQQPRGGPSADARTEAEPHGLAAARLGSRAETVILSSSQLPSSG